MRIEDLQKDMITAMKARDKFTKEALSLLIAAIKKVAIDNEVRDNIPEEMVDTVILKETKLVKEQIDSCPDSRQDLKEEYQKKYEVFVKYAPKQLSDDEIEAFIKTNFSELIESKNKGLLIKNAVAALKGKADGKLISNVVNKIIN